MYNRLHLYNPSKNFSFLPRPPRIPSSIVFWAHFSSRSLSLPTVKSKVNIPSRSGRKIVLGKKSRKENEEEKHASRERLECRNECFWSHKRGINLGKQQKIKNERNWNICWKKNLIYTRKSLKIVPHLTNLPTTYLLLLFPFVFLFSFIYYFFFCHFEIL